MKGKKSWEREKQSSEMMMMITWRARSMCSLVCGIGPSGAETTRIPPSIWAAPVIIFWIHEFIFTISFWNQAGIYTIICDLRTHFHIISMSRAIYMSIMPLPSFVFHVCLRHCWKSKMVNTYNFTSIMQFTIINQKTDLEENKRLQLISYRSNGDSSLFLLRRFINFVESNCFRLPFFS